MNRLLIILLVFTCFSVSATVHTVDNSANSVAQFRDLQSAIDAANVGDTLLIKGTYIPYGYPINHPSTRGIVLDKQLVMIGEGAYGHPAGPTLDDRLRLTNIGDLYLGANASGSKFIGLWLDRVTFGLVENQAELISNIEFSDLAFHSFAKEEAIDAVDGFEMIRSHVRFPVFELMDNIQNVRVANSIVRLSNPEGILFQSGENVLINNIIMVSLNAPDFIIYDQDSDGNDLYEQELLFQNVKLLNNVFALNPRSSTLENRLVFKSSGSEIRNCIVMGPTVTRSLLSSGNVETLVSNLSIEREPFVRIPPSEGFEAEVIRAATFFGDYHLAEGSVGKSNGTDGTDIGIYGGDTPWIDGPVWNYSNVPQLPTIESLQLIKKVVKPGEGLKVRVKASAKGN